MNYQGDIEIVKQLEKVICGWNEVRLVKDGSIGELHLSYQPTPTLYTRVYEVYVSRYVFPIRLTFDERQGSQKGRMSIPNIDSRILFNAVYGLKELVDKLTPMTGQWQPINNGLVLNSNVLK